MKTIKLENPQSSAATLLHSAQDEPVLVSLPDGNRYLISHADDLQTEVELLRRNQEFLDYLDEARRDPTRHSMDEVRKLLNA